MTSTVRPAPVGHGRAPDPTRAARDGIDAVLGSVVPPGSTVALLGAPDHSNVGDSWLWVAQRRWLRDHGVRVRAAAPYGRVDHGAVRQAVGPDGIVLLSAGGHLTDRWPDMLDGIRAAVERLPGHRIVLLPQSIHFDDALAARRVAASIRSHGAVTVLVRDMPSVGRAAAAGLGAVTVCPDLSFVDLGLDRWATPARAGAPPVVVRRADRESAAHDDGVGTRADAGPARGSDQEWISPRSGWRAGAWFGARAAWRTVARLAPRAASDPATVGRLVDLQARLALARGVRIIGPAPVVVTDRLHAALLAHRLGRRVVAVDSGTGKVHDVLGTWLPDDPRVRRVGSWDVTALGALRRD